MWSFDPDDVDARVAHAFKVERILTLLGYVVAVVGLMGIGWTLFEAVSGDIAWTRAGVTGFGILAATVLSGAAAYGSGTNVGLAAMRLREQRKSSQ